MSIQRIRTPNPPTTNSPSTSSTSPEKQFDAQSPISSTSSSTTPAVPASTIYKLLVFTAGMFTLPLLSYYGTVHTLFKGNATYAGALAALVANAVLFGYIIVAVAEDKGDEGASGRKVGKIE